MADDVELSPGSGGDIIGADDIGGVKYQRVKVIIGANNTNDGDVSAANPMPVLVDSSALPSGAATAAKQDSQTALLTTIDADTAALAACASGAELQVDVVSLPAIPAGNNNIGDVDVASLPALPAGNNNIGDVDVASIAAGDNNIGNVDVVTLPALPAGNNNIGDVDVASVVPGTAATNLGKAIDTATGATDTGVLALVTRDDALTTLTPADGDNVAMRVDSVGRLWTSATVIEDVAHAADSQLMAVATRRIDTAASSSGSSGDNATLDQSAEGALWATLTPTTTSGLSTMNATSSDGATALTNSAQAIKASAGNLYGYYLYNPNSSAVFVQFYNTASGSVTVGTTNPLFMITLPASSAANLMFPYPVAFSTAMSWAATSTAGGNGAPSTALDAVAWYK